MAEGPHSADSLFGLGTEMGAEATELGEGGSTQKGTRQENGLPLPCLSGTRLKPEERSWRMQVEPSEVCPGRSAHPVQVALE